MVFIEDLRLCVTNSYKPILDEFLQSLRTITENNKVLVETNSSFVGNVNTKMEDIEQKVDRIMETLV